MNVGLLLCIPPLPMLMTFDMIHLVIMFFFTNGMDLQMDHSPSFYHVWRDEPQFANDFEVTGHQMTRGL